MAFKTRTDVYKMFTFLKKIMHVCNFSYKTFSIVGFIVVEMEKDVEKKSKKVIFWVKNLLFWQKNLIPEHEICFLLFPM